MQRRAFNLGTGLAFSFPAFAAADSPRIALMAAAMERTKLEPLFSELSRLGYDTRTVEEHYEARTVEQERSIAREIVRLAPDIIVTYSNPDIVAAKEATSKIPIVMVVSSTPVESGLIATLDHPGGNVTGTTVQAAAMGAKLIELLKEASPRASSVALLWEPTYPGMDAYYREALRGAAALGVRYQEYRVATEREFEQAMEAIRRARPNALYVSMTSQLYLQWQRLVNLAAELKLPAIYTEQFVVPAGGLIAYSADHAALMRRSAQFVDRILKGAKPADLPVEEPNNFLLGINVNTARTLGLTVPRSLLLRATTVVGE